MDDKEGIGIASITLDPGKKTRADQVCTGVGIAELAVGGPEGAAAVADEYARAHKSYESNSARKAKALSISGKPGNFLAVRPQRMHAFEAGRQLVATRNARSNFTIADANGGSVQCEFEHL
jgi:hypothetical protein